MLFISSRGDFLRSHFRELNFGTISCFERRLGLLGKLEWMGYCDVGILAAIQKRKSVEEFQDSRERLDVNLRKDEIEFAGVLGVNLLGFS
jgi:hypothetical protein